MKIVHAFLIIIAFAVLMFIVVDQPIVEDMVTDSGYTVEAFYAGVVVIVASLTIFITAVTGGR